MSADGAVYQLRPRRVRAWRLNWSNWEALADKVKGKFHQRLVIDRAAIRSTMPNQGRAYLEVPNVKGGYEVCRIGDWVVEESAGEFGVWNDAEFTETFEPSHETYVLSPAPQAELEA